MRNWEEGDIEMKKIILILILNCVLCISLFSQENINLATDIQKTESINVNNNYEILETKLESCKESFDRVNTTYQWSIGIMLTAILAFLGITSYNYHKNYKADLQKIRDELEHNYQQKVDELLQKNSKSISDKTNLLEHRLKQELLKLQYDFYSYKFNHETNERIKLTLSLNILNTLSESNWGFSDWLFNDYMQYIKECCLKGILFDHSEVDDVKDMLSKLPDRLNPEKEKLQAVINYEK